MILDSLDFLKVPYIVVKYRLTSIIDDEYAHVYEVIAKGERGALKRLGFTQERNTKYREKIYMSRRLSDKEIKIFKLNKYMPYISNDQGVVWEFNGGLKKSRK